MSFGLSPIRLKGDMEMMSKVPDMEWKKTRRVSKILRKSTGVCDFPVKDICGLLSHLVHCFLHNLTLFTLFICIKIASVQTIDIVRGHVHVQNFSCCAFPVQPTNGTLHPSKFLTPYPYC